MNGDEELNEDEEAEGELADSIGDRPVRKAKRQLARQTSGGESSTNNNAQTAAKKVVPFSKNSRKSRDGRGRGLPKKGLPYLLCVQRELIRLHGLQVLCSCNNCAQYLLCVPWFERRLLDMFLFTFVFHVLAWFGREGSHIVCCINMKMYACSSCNSAYSLKDSLKGFVIAVVWVCVQMRK
jgi:hypothetical protein